METYATNVRPRRSRRASMSSMPSDIDDPEELKKALTMAKTKEELYEDYKAEKAARLKAHEDAEEMFRKKVEVVELEATSGLAEQEEEITTRVSLETFERPKVSRRQRRASMGVSLEILAPLEDYKLELEEVTRVDMPISPIVSTPTFDGGIFTGGAWDGSAVADPNVMFSAEALAGWVAVEFNEGPLGMQLEPTVGDKACRVTGFIETLGCPSQARDSGKVKFDDVIVKVNGKVPESYEETLQMIAEGGQRTITFRPGFSYELEDFSAKLDSPKEKKKKVGRAGRRASMGAIPSLSMSSPKDVFSELEEDGISKDATDYGYGDTGGADMGYGEAASDSHKRESPKVKKKSSSRKGRRASCVAAMPNMPGLVSAVETSKPKKDSDADNEPVAPVVSETKKKSSKRGRRASMSTMPPAAMPGLVSATEATIPTAEESIKAESEVKKEKKSKSSSSKKSEPSAESDHKKEKKASRKSRRASMSAIPSNMSPISAVQDADETKTDKKKKKSSDKKKKKSKE